MNLAEIRHNYTEWVVNHRKGLHRTAIGLAIAAVPTAVAVDVVLDTQEAPVVILAGFGAGAIADSLSIAGYGIDQTRTGQQGPEVVE